VYFGKQNIEMAVVVIVVLLVAIIATIIALFKVDKTAAYLLIPYLLWVCFATFLNYSLWQLN
jgi:tryptophan-rich sensory protein